MAAVISATLAGDGRFDTVLVTPDPDGGGLVGIGPSVDLRTGFAIADMGRLLTGADAVIMAGGAWANTADIARLARRWGCHYLDVAESPASAEKVADIARGAAQAFAPGCGLAPGYVTALVGEHLQTLGRDGRITAHVGVLPQNRTNRLGYGNIWGVDGLLVEYTAPCEAIRAGRRVSLDPLSELEVVSVGGEVFESFTTAGSLDALVARSEGRVSDLVFKTLRYPGHLDYIRFLIEDLDLAGNRQGLRSLLMNGLPVIENDRILIALDIQRAPGLPVERLEQVLRARCDGAGQWHSAGLAATAAHVCAMADLLCQGRIAQTGCLPQGSVSLKALQESAFFAPLWAGTLHKAMEV